MDKLNKELLFQGAAGLSFDATARADAIAARKTLDAAGLQMITLLELARERAESAAPPPNKCDILKTLRNFLDEKEEENRADRTISNLRNRITQWIEREGMLFVEDINRERCEALRARSGVSALTRRNDMAAASAFCSWLTDKKLLPHHPMRDLRKPRIDYKAPAILSPRQAKKLLNCALKRGNKQVLASLAIMLFSGPRPSEMPLAKIFYEDSPCVRLEGGKLRGRANRIVSIPPNALAWLERAGFLEQPGKLSDRQRQTLCRLTGIKWIEDIHRHSFITYRLAESDNAALVAREAGTSEEMIYSKYARLRTKKEALEYFSIFPPKLSD